jgi:hypothetical protein
LHGRGSEVDENTIDLFETTALENISHVLVARPMDGATLPERLEAPPSHGQGLIVNVDAHIAFDGRNPLEKNARVPSQTEGSVEDPSRLKLGDPSEDYR